jgi:RNase H-fold protein (predicted Holliday junction resolvase)
MDSKEFFDTVVLMRKHQRDYERSNRRDRQAERYAKEFEKRIDYEIKRVELITKERISPRLNFD